MTRSPYKNEVVGIGALGGSGTRVIAQILRVLEFNLGKPLNESYDNLIFTALLKQPNWKHQATADEIGKRLHLFERYMLGKSLGLGGKWLLSSLAKHHPDVSAHSFNGNYWPQRQPKLDENTKWAFKEPNSHFYLPELSQYFNKLKYIYVERHGLDMAFSENKQQLANWSNSKTSTQNLNVQQLDHWINTHERVTVQGKEFLGSDFYLLNFDRLCKEPETELEFLLSFLEIPGDTQLIDKCVRLIEAPKSMGRYQAENLSMFSKKQLEKVQQLGFSV